MTKYIVKIEISMVVETEGQNEARELAIHGLAQGSSGQITDMVVTPLPPEYKGDK